jgi:hypothetical protein
MTYFLIRRYLLWISGDGSEACTSSRECQPAIPLWVSSRDSCGVAPALKMTAQYYDLSEIKGMLLSNVIMGFVSRIVLALLEF